MSLLAQAVDPAGPAAEDIDDLWRLLLWTGPATFVIFAVLLVAALVHRRSGEHDPTDTGRDDLHGRTIRPWLVGGGVLLPTAGVIVVLVATVSAMRATAGDVTDDALVVEVTGNQWWWEVTYPAHAVETANEVHIPAGSPVTLVLGSTDVIHSFWVPALAGKMDALPDDDNRLVIEADEPGRYDGACAEFCGIQHANMAISVVAHPPDEFDAWLARQRSPADRPTGAAADEGRTIFQRERCGACHTVRGTDADGDRGPDLTHLSSRRMIAGGALRLTAEDLERWLSAPHDVKQGTKMPDPELTDAEVDALVAYLVTLG